MESDLFDIDLFLGLAGLALATRALIEELAIVQ